MSCQGHWHTCCIQSIRICWAEVTSEASAETKSSKKKKSTCRSLPHFVNIELKFNVLGCTCVRLPIFSACLLPTTEKKMLYVCSGWFFCWVSADLLACSSPLSWTCQTHFWHIYQYILCLYDMNPPKIQAKYGGTGKVFVREKNAANMVLTIQFCIQDRHFTLLSWLYT